MDEMSENEILKSVMQELKAFGRSARLRRVREAAEQALMEPAAPAEGMTPGEGDGLPQETAPVDGDPLAALAEDELAALAPLKTEEEGEDEEEEEM